MTKPLLTASAHQQILDALKERHGGMLKDESFALEVRREGADAVAAQLTLSNMERTHVYTMEAALQVSERSPMTTTDAVDVCLDFLDWHVGDYLATDRQSLLPLDFHPHPFSGQEVYAKGEVHNLVLEEAADAWLRGERPETETRETRKI